MRVFRLWIFCTLLSWTLFGAQTLHTSDVRKVMDELFEFHIDKKEISPLVLERSLKIYIDDFDVKKAYLLKGEVAPFVRPSSQFLQGVLAGYQQDDFASYFELNTRMAHAIVRARQWRSDWVQDPAMLVAAARNLSITSLKEREEFPSTTTELQRAHYEEFLRVIRYRLDDLGAAGIAGKEKKLVALCDRQIFLAESPYLGHNEDGEALSAADQEHGVVLRMLKAFARSLDAHTAYYSPEEAYSMKVQLEKGMCGIGVVLHEGIEGVMIADIVKGGPAEKKGALVVGDRIIEIDGTSVVEHSFHKVLDLLKGEEGTKAVLGVMRKEQYLQITLTRAHIVLEDKRVDISTEAYGDGIIGKITLYSFYEGDDGISSEKDIRSAIEQLRKEGPLYGLVLDLRDNGGGFLSQAVRVGSLFISSGVVVISKYSDGSMKYYRGVEGRRYYDGPLLVLISKGSASATEIVAQALQDYGVALVVGDSRTFGKGTIQHQTVTSGKDSLFKVTVGRYYTVSGKSTQIEGVKADIMVPTALEFEKIGEAYLDYPLPPDHVAACFHDTLTDLDPYARKWFAKYYLPTLQNRLTTWQDHLPLLRENSRRRLKENALFQSFLHVAQTKEGHGDKSLKGRDLQMEESVNIVKDMIFLQQEALSAREAS